MTFASTSNINRTTTVSKPKSTVPATKSESRAQPQATDTVALSSTQSVAEGSQFKDLSAAQRQLNLAKSQVNEITMRDEYELFCGRRNSKHGNSLNALLGMTAGLAAGIMLASSTNNPALAIPAFLGAPMIGLAGGALLESRVQDAYMDRFNSKLLPAQEQVAKWESVVSRLEQAPG